MHNRSVISLTFLQFAAVILGLFQTVVVARLFGTTRQIEIFMAASSLNATALRLFQSGQIYEIFLPKYISVKRSQGTNTANQLSSVLVTWILICFIMVSFGLFIVAPFIVEIIISGFSASDQLQATLMFRAVIPVIGIQLLSGVFLMLGNAEKNFSTFQIPSLLSLGLSILILILIQDSIGAWVMVITLWANQLTTLIFRLILIRRIGFRYSFRLRSEHLSVRIFFLKILTTIPSTTATTFFEIIFTRELSQLSQGDLAVVNYARQILSKIRGLIVRPTSIVFFTAISESVIETRLKTKALISRALEQVLSFILIASIISWHTLPFLTFALYCSEDFSLDKILQLASLINFLLLALLFDGLGVIYQKYNVSSERVTQQYISMAMAKLAVAFLAWFLIPLFGYTGAIIVLIAQSIFYALASFLVVKRLKYEILAIYSGKSILKWSLIWTITWFLFTGIYSTGFIELTPETTRTQASIITIISGIILMSTALGLGVIFKIAGVNDLLSSITRLRNQEQQIAV